MKRKTVTTVRWGVNERLAQLDHKAVAQFTGQGFSFKADIIGLSAHQDDRYQIKIWFRFHHLPTSHDDIGYLVGTIKKVLATNKNVRDVDSCVGGYIRVLFTPEKEGFCWTAISIADKMLRALNVDSKQRESLIRFYEIVQETHVMLYGEWMSYSQFLMLKHPALNGQVA